jgi:hypothetical protein
VVLIAGFVLVGVLVFVLWPKQSKVRIEIIRRAFDAEKERDVVYFRIVGADGKWIRISQIDTVFDNNVPSSSMAGVIMAVRAKEEGRVLASILTDRDQKEFGRPSPAGATVWKMRVTLTTKMPIFKRLPLLPSTILRTRRAGSPLWQGIRDMWNGWDSWVIESEPITNAVASTSEVTK